MKIELPDIPESEQSPLVKGLLLIIEQLTRLHKHKTRYFCSGAGASRKLVES